MREKYESLSLTVLRDLAKARGMKGVSSLKKAGLVEAMLRQDELDAAAAAGSASAAPATDAPAADAPGDGSRADSRPEKERSGNGETAEKSRTPEAPPARGPRRFSSRPAGKTEQPAEHPAQRATERQTQQPEKHPAQRSAERQTQQPEKYPAQRSAERQTQQPEKYPAQRFAERQTQQPAERTAQSRMPQELNYDDARDAQGILEILQDGYGFIRSDNYMPGENDIYVSPSQIRRFNLKTGDIIRGKTRKNNPNDKFGALLYITDINGYEPDVAAKRTSFEDLTPIFPNERIRLERPGCSVAMRVVDMISPVGKGQRGMIVSQPKAGKTTLLKEIARSVIANHPEIHLIILLIDERPEEVTDIRESIASDSVEVIYSTFDETPEHHKRVSEMVVERARRLVEHHQDVMILLDSITRMARAYNLTVAPSGRTLSGGLDPAALHMPKRFFGAARNMREGGSLTILATALVETGSKMDDVVFEEFKGTGNMELVLDRKLSERRIFPAIDINKSGTRRDDLLLSAEERAATDVMHRGLNGRNHDDVTESILNIFAHTKDNASVVREILRRKIV